MTLWRLGAAVTLCAAYATGCSRAPGTLSDRSLEDRIDRYMSAHVARGDFSGTVLVARGPRTLAVRSYGRDGVGGSPNQGATRYHVASLSKALTATGIMLLVQDGALSVTDPISTWVPDFPNGDAIRLHELLTHTSGVPDINRFPEYAELSQRSVSLDELVTVIRRRSADASPGAYAYSNSNYNLLAYVIESVSGRSYAEFMEARVFEPLGMKGTAHSGSPRDRGLAPAARGQIPSGRTDVAPAPHLDWSVKTGNGSIVSTVQDLATFLRRLGERPLLEAHLRDEMLRPHVEGRYAYGWFVAEGPHGPRYYMNGNTPGYSAAMELHPAEEVAVVVLANHDVPLASGIARDMASIMLGESIDDPMALPRYEVTVDPADYLGHYEFGIGFDITEEAGEVVASGPWPPYASVLVPTDRDVFFHRYWRSELRFDRDTTGVVTALEWEGRSAPRN